jgi:glutaredoxin
MVVTPGRAGAGGVQRVPRCARSWCLRSLAVAVLLVAAALPVPATAGEGCALVEVFHREGCPHCERALDFLSVLAAETPGLVVRDHEIGADAAARERFLALSEAHGVARPGVPSVLACGTFLVGYDPQATPGAIRALVRGDALPPPGAAAGTASVTLPLVGTVALDDAGLVLFTVAVGLLDGFNPCAMWVLLFLLSLLVNLRSRRRMLLVAGTFVAVSGLVYFAFMAAWLNLFLVVGASQALQVLLGVLALLIGVVHVKDFVAAGKGPSLSIPDSAKPGLYARVRAVVQAENLAAALVLVTLLAALVNLVELLCTAGLPALYTRILTLQELPVTAYYGYLGLYNLAYVADDLLMVAVVVWTLERARLRPEQGRWLKLVSGVTVLALGAALLAAPQWLF